MIKITRELTGGLTEALPLSGFCKFLLSLLNLKSSAWNSFYLLDILLDETLIGRIRLGQTKEFNIEDGIHQLRVRYDKLTSDTITFEHTNNCIIEFKCGNYTALPFSYAESYVIPQKYSRDIYLFRLINKDDIKNKHNYKYDSTF